MGREAKQSKAKQTPDTWEFKVFGELLAPVGRCVSVETFAGKKLAIVRNVSKNWHIPPSFPSEAVVSAYSTPQVDKSAETFSWGKPDIFILRKLKFGWNSKKADELLLPVLNEYNKHESMQQGQYYGPMCDCAEFGTDLISHSHLQVG
ncbi:hypothetical protein CRG98_045266 [Punica granatum]|uniref:Uncharacterized protein n=1 Tax=Punica granatum TaxID=22663 RepID=A0A2I0HS94_PUNGR|nr:hypothetical protein CRG98_045266 [Punica granatum]